MFLVKLGHGVYNVIHTQEQLLKWLDESPHVRPCVKRALDQGSIEVERKKLWWEVRAKLGRHQYKLEVHPSKKFMGEHFIVEIYDDKTT